MNIKELREKATRLSNQAKDVLDAITEETRADKEAEFNRMMDEADSVANQADRLEAAEAREARYNEIVTETASTRGEARSEQTSEEDEFRSYLRGETRAMSVGNDAGGKGGATVPTTVLAEIVSALKDFGPLNEGGPARYLVTETGAPIKVPTADNTAGTASVKAENATAGSKDHAIGSVTITVDTHDSGLFQLSNELIRDSGADVVRFVIDNCAENLGRKANALHTANLLAGAGTASFTAASGSGITSDEFLKLAYDVNSAYRRKGAFMFNSQTELAARLLKDANNNYLWQPSYSADKPATIAGLPYYTNDDMPNMTAGAEAIAFGDFSRFYVRRAGSVVVRRSDDLLMAENAVAFVGFMSIGSAVVDAKAIKTLVMGA